MNKVREKLMSIVKGTVRKIAEREAEEWPPLCCGPYYQPERPVQSDAKDEAETNAVK